MRAAAIALSVLSAIGGFAVAVILFVLGLAFTVGDNDKYGKVGLPGEAMVRLPEGDVLVYYEERAAYAATPPEGLRLVVRSAADREQVPARPVGNRSSYEINDVTGFSIARLQVPEEGRFIVVAGRPRRGAFDPAVTLGPDLDIGALLLRCVLAVLAGLALSVLFGLLARSRRPPPAPVPPPHSSAPLAPWQAPRTGSTAHRRRGR